MTSQPLVLEVDGAVARVTFNRPDVLNAFDHNSAVALLDTFRQIAGNRAVRVVVMQGAGRAFMAGGDINVFAVPPEQAPAHFKRLLDPFHEAIEIMMGMEIPVVAAVHGAAAGAGFSLAMAADLVIAAADARFTMAYTKLGVSADGSISWSLPRLVGLRKALELAFFSDSIKADEALSLGLVNRVVPAADFASERDALVARLAGGPTIAFGKMKRLLRLSLENTLPQQLRAEEAALMECVVTTDFRSGIEGFQSKTPSLFKGR